MKAVLSPWPLYTLKPIQPQLQIYIVLTDLMQLIKGLIVAPDELETEHIKYLNRLC